MQIKKNNKINKAPLFWVRCIDLYSPFSMLFSVWQNDFPALWESQRFSHISLSDWWETPHPVLLLTLKININLLCVHSRVSVASLRDAWGTDLYSSNWVERFGILCQTSHTDLGTVDSGGFDSHKVDFLYLASIVLQALMFYKDFWLPLVVISGMYMATTVSGALMTEG